MLRRTRAHPLSHTLALTIGALVLFVVLWTAMLMRVSSSGIVHESDLLDGPLELIKRGLWPVGLVVGFTTAFAPLSKLLAMVYVLVGLQMARPLPLIGKAYLFARKMTIWAMLDVLLLGVFVAYTKLGDLVHIEVGPAVYALGLLTVVMLWADTALDPDAVWDEIERKGLTHAPMPNPALARAELHRAIGCEACGLVSVPQHRRWHDHAQCPRCGSALHARKPASIARTWAFLIAGAIFYIPANYFPVLTVVQLGAGEPSTIIGGVEELIAAQLYPLAILVLTASVLVPVLKLAGLVMLLLAALASSPQRSNLLGLRQRTSIYFVVAWIGRWSMVDIFMESLLGALVQFGGLVTIDPGLGALAFCAVVILTMLSAEAFDPRLMWDAAGVPHRAPAAAAPGVVARQAPSVP
ncbi:MAG: paraquat-inducible protein A [Acetobacteraceae bacterium]|nr:paraquat-inducible protein A [Pseudomonadota bacterium]